MGPIRRGVPRQGQRNKPVTGYCSRCGEPLSAGQKTCPNCGHHNG
nr:zinc ribbon domain-containing protein [Nocardiopsis halotolerans]